MKIQLIRHATLIISVNNKRILVDPLLSEAGSMAPIENVPNQNYNPLVELPIDINNITNFVRKAHSFRCGMDST